VAKRKSRNRSASFAFDCLWEPTDGALRSRLICVNSARRPRGLSALWLLSALAIVFAPAQAESGIGPETSRFGVEAAAHVLAPASGEGIWRYQSVPEPSRGKSPLLASQGVLSAALALVLAAFGAVVVRDDGHSDFGAHSPASSRGPPPG
jgi:hypothetical protein